MAFNPTKQQEQAINRQGNILVAAAAGSGKTAVLVERVISKLCDKEKGIPADKLLIVTFTKAAAFEMRSRIEKRLDEEIEKDPSNISISMQKHLLNSAKICTIDSFCIDLVRENFEKLDISPDFKISDGPSLNSLNKRILQDIVNRYLNEDNQTFLKLLDIIGAEFDENNFTEFIESLYNYSRQLPFPEKWFDFIYDNYALGFNQNNLWFKYAVELCESLSASIKKALIKAKDFLYSDEKVKEKWSDSFNTAIDFFENLEAFAQNSDWNGIYNLINGFELPKLPTVKGINDIYEISAAKSVYKIETENTLSRLEKIYCGSKEEIDEQFSFLKEPIGLLTDILKEYDKLLFEEYKKINTFTFHNTEQLAFKLLCEEQDGKIVIRKDTSHLLERFEEVMVDEYQDTNDLQDKLFYILSHYEKNLFVVGDVKQSIYCFRGANPKNFLSKKNRYIDISNAKENEPQKIILGNNFRTRPEVCDFINFFFKIFMNEKTGELIYNSEEELVPSAKYPDADFTATELHILNSKDSEDSNLILEAKRIANIIKDYTQNKKIIRADEKTLREVKYSDFTVLLRNAKAKAPLIAQILEKYGIPVNFSSEEYIETTEISTFLSLLKLIDNPQSDIDLLTVMMSPIFYFTPEEMALIRSEKQDGSLYSAVINSRNMENPKTLNFLKALESFRRLSVTNTLPELISLLLEKTNYLNIVSALEDGEKRRNNLLLLSNYATQFSNGENITISSFIKQIEKFSNGGIKGCASLVSSNSVKIMSIHSSKGLQFPICIVADTGTKFNDNEAYMSYLFNTELGLGFRYFDEAIKTKITTVSREVILNKIRADRLEEELRLLYVAMTRTQDKLIFIGSCSDIETKNDKLKSLLSCSDGLIDGNALANTKSYLDWLILAMLLHPCGKELRGEGSNITVNMTNSKIDFFNLYDEDIIDYDVVKETDAKIDLETVASVKENLGYAYPFKDILEIESKTSVSKLKGRATAKKYAFSARPSFMNKNGLSAAQKGTAIHKVMQFFDFSKYQDIESEIERLYEWQFISEEEKNAVDFGVLQKFFGSDIFKRILDSKNINREMRFLTEISAYKINPLLSKESKNEKIIVQGAVDICFEEDDGIVILDFKTDMTDNIEDLRESYKEQLNIYSLACEKIFKKRVKQKLIYSFFLGSSIEVL